MSNIIKFHKRIGSGRKSKIEHMHERNMFGDKVLMHSFSNNIHEVHGITEIPAETLDDFKSSSFYEGDYFDPAALTGGVIDARVIVNGGVKALAMAGRLARDSEKNGTARGELKCVLFELAKGKDKNEVRITGTDNHALFSQVIDASFELRSEKEVYRYAIPYRAILAYTSFASDGPAFFEFGERGYVRISFRSKGRTPFDGTIIAEIENQYPDYELAIPVVDYAVELESTEHGSGASVLLKSINDLLLLTSEEATPRRVTIAFHDLFMSVLPMGKLSAAKSAPARVVFSPKGRHKNSPVKNARRMFLFRPVYSNLTINEVDPGATDVKVINPVILARILKFATSETMTISVVLGTSGGIVVTW